MNDAHAEMAAKQPDRLAAYAALPLPHVDASLLELRRCLDDLGMVGIALQCFCFDESLAAERFEPIYAELNRRKAVVFFHPCVNGLCSPLISQWGLAPTAGAVFEDTTIALHLIVRQIPHRFPDIRFIVPHLGGALPMLLSRLDNQLPLSTPGLPERPSVTARRFFTTRSVTDRRLRCDVRSTRSGPTASFPAATTRYFSVSKATPTPLATCSTPDCRKRLCTRS